MEGLQIEGGYSRIKLAEESLNNWQVVGDGGEGEYIFHP